MAIDLTNRNPSDPNGVASISSNQTPAWISDDWGTLTLDQTEGQAKKLREVRVVRVTTNDGREFRAVLDGNGQPISVIGDQTGINTDQQSAFKGQQSTTKAPNGQQYSRGPDGTINEWNPNSTPPGYNIPHPEMSPAGTVYTPEQRQAQGSQAQIDASKAAEATRVANESSWNADPANRANGGSGRYETHADRDARLAKEKIDVDARTRQQTIDAQNAATAAANSRRADSAEARAVAEANKVGSKITESTINGQHYTTIVTTSPDGKTSKIENFGPDGNRVAELPKPAQIPANAPKYSVDWSKPGLGLVEYAAAVRADPTLTDEQKTQLITEAHTSATAVTGQATGIINAQQQQTSNEISQRGQDLTAASARATNAGSIWNNALTQGNQATRLSTGPGAATAPIFLAAMGQAFGQGMGGGAPTAPRVQPGVAAQQVQGMGIPGMGAPAVPTVASVLAGAGMPGAAPVAAGPATITNTPGAGAMLAQNEANRQLDMATQAQAGASAPVAAPVPMPAGPTPPLGQGQDISTPPAGGINPAAGQPGNDPTKPVGMMPPSMFGGGPWGAPPAQPTGAAMPVLASAMNGYDPTAVNRELVAAGMDPQIAAMFGGTGTVAA